MISREEWSVDSVGGGVTGTRAEIEQWLDSVHDEYGSQFDGSIHIRRRLVIESEWLDVELDWL